MFTIDPEDREAAYTVALGLIACAAGIYALHLAGFRFNMGVST